MSVSRQAGAGWRRMLAAGCCALALAGCGGSVELMAAIPENEANEVLAVLLNAGIHAQKVAGKEGMVSLQVDTDKVARAIDALRARGLPRERFSGMGEIFKKEGLISSPLEERVRYLYALAQELSNTITKIDGVIVARVHVVLPERGSAGDPNLPSSAAVFVKYQEGYNLDTVQPQIRRLVTNSIPGLTTDRVSVILVSAQSAQSAQSSQPALGQGGTAAVAALARGTVGSAGTDGANGSSRIALVAGLLALALAALAAAAFAVKKYVLPLRARKPAARPGAAAVAPVEPMFDERLS